MGLVPLEAAGCLAPKRLPANGESLLPVPGFPGLSVVTTGGHTPGSQLFVARVKGDKGEHVWVFSGDIVNAADGFLHNVPKPAYYSLLIVPEHRKRLDRLRRYLLALDKRPDVTVVVSHDEAHLKASGMLPW